jgi:hypothetical protein
MEGVSCDCWHCERCDEVCREGESCSCG